MMFEMDGMELVVKFNKFYFEMKVMFLLGYVLDKVVLEELGEDYFLEKG